MKGRAPPVDSFSGGSLDVFWEDWIPTLERAVLWNGWSDEELLQLAGHLWGKAQQEWALLPEDQKATFVRVTQSLRGRLDPGGQVVAAQDFRHVMQQPAGSVWLTMSDIWNVLLGGRMDEKHSRKRPEIHCCMVRCRKDCVIAL